MNNIQNSGTAVLASGERTNVNKKRKRKRKSNIKVSRGDEKNLFPLLTSKPVQGKKTVEIFHQRSKHLNKNTLNIMLCQNFKNQADQLETRVEGERFDQDLYKYIQENDSKVFVLHGGKDNNKSPHHYLYNATERDKRDFIVISNKTRLMLLSNIINEWLTKPNRKVFVHLDEADKTFKSFSKYVLDNTDPKNITTGKINLHFVTASCEKLGSQVKKYYKGFTIAERTQNLDNYISIMNISWNDHSDWKTYESILNDYERDTSMINNNDYIFWPLNYINERQFAACEEISSRINSVILLENGKGNHIYRRDCQNVEVVHTTEKKRPCSKSRSPCNSLSCTRCNPTTANDHIKYLQAIKKKYARNKPLIICGNMCLGRAMTLHCAEFPFTKAFFSKEIMETILRRNKSNADTYQLLCRILGSFRKDLIKNNVPLPLVYGPIYLRNTIITEEKAATYIAGLESETIIDDDDLEAIYAGQEITSTTIKEMNIDIPDEYQYIVNIRELNIDDIIQKINRCNTNLGIKKYQKQTIQKIINSEEHKDIKIIKNGTTANIRVSFTNERNIFKFGNKQLKIIL